MHTEQSYLYVSRKRERQLNYFIIIFFNVRCLGLSEWLYVYIVIVLVLSVLNFIIFSLYL